MGHLINISSVSSYQTTVTGEFFSHTHVDEIHLSKDDDGRPFAVTYVAPSLSPWKNVNPGYKVYTIDGARGAQSTWVRNVAELQRRSLIKGCLTMSADSMHDLALLTSLPRLRRSKFSGVHWNRFDPRLS